MDELTIDDRKYISSKRAAEITGYAKDYVGQLCRGGYVTARRIGRNWYVLESAIKDHRFGIVASESPKPAMAALEAQEAPRYMALDTQPLEPANLLGRVPAAMHSASPPADAGEPPQNDFQEAWQAWFEMFRGRENDVANIVAEPIAREQWSFDNPPPDVEDIAAEPVPLQILTHDPPHISPDIPALHARHAPVQAVSRHEAQRPTPARVAGQASKLQLIIQTILILLTLTLAGTAIMSTGFFDKTIASYKQVQLLSGVLQYDK